MNVLNKYAISKKFDIQKVFYCNAINGVYENSVDSANIALTKETMLNGEAIKEMDNALDNFNTFQEMIDFIGNSNFRDITIIELYGTLPVKTIFNTLKVKEVHWFSNSNKKWLSYNIEMYKENIRKQISDSLNYINFLKLTNNIDEIGIIQDKVNKTKEELFNLQNKYE
jgi:hypothetical protein